MSQMQNKNSGMILILSILVIGAILGTIIIFSNLITREIQQSRLIDQSIHAFYLAESGAERALWQTRRQEAVKFEDCADIMAPDITDSVCIDDETSAFYGTCSDNGNRAVACITTDKGSLDIEGTWENLTAKNEGEMIIPLSLGESFQMDLFSPYQSTGGATGDGLTFYKPDGTPTNLNSFVIQNNLGSTTLFGELVNLTTLTGSTLNCDPFGFDSISKGTIQVSISVGTVHSSAYITGFLGGETIDTACNYVLRVSNTVLLNPLNGLFTISIHDDSSVINDADPEGFQNDLESSRILIPSRLLIESEARFGKSLQRIQVRTSVRPPLSGLYDFVLFSELEITK